MANITYVTGRATSTAGYVRVGHQSGSQNNDAVWSFSVPVDFKSIKFELTWNNTAAGTGWEGNFTYVFAISSDSSLAQTAYSGTHLAKKTLVLGGKTGTAEVVFTGLNLKANTTYYLRANVNGTTLSTLKAFKQSGNIRTSLFYKGQYVDTLIYNGNTLTNVTFNGNTITI